MSLLSQRGARALGRLAPSARALCGEQLRHFSEAAAPASADDDIVLSSFRKSQTSYQELMKGLQAINIPLTGDDAAIKKYAQEVEALKKKVGIPDVEDVINAELDYKFATSGFNVQKFALEAAKSLPLDEELRAVVEELAAAVGEAERASGRELDAANEKGWQLLTAKLGEVEKKYGLTNKAKVREEAVFDLYKKHIAALRAQVEDDVNKVRKAENLEFIEADLAALKPKLV